VTLSLGFMTTDPSTDEGAELPSTVTEGTRHGEIYVEGEASKQRGFWQTEQANSRRQSLWDIFLRRRKEEGL
jgi:hypothetical protein